MKIENAQKEDVIELIKLAAVMLKESPTYNPFNDDFDAVKVYDMLTFMIDHPDQSIVIVARTDQGEIAGGFVGYIDVMWMMKSTKVMSDLALFMHPKHRGGSTAVNLLKEVFRLAHEKGCKQVQITNTSGVASDQVEKLYQFVGMKRNGGSYKLDL